MEQKSQIPEGVLKYLQGLMIEKELDSLPGNIQGEMLYDLYIRYNDFLIASFLQAMDEGARDEFDKLLEKKPNQDEIEKFLKEKLDYQEIIKETSDEFRDIFLGKEEGK